MAAHDRRYRANYHAFDRMTGKSAALWAAHIANNPHLPLSQTILSTAVELRLKGQL